MARRNGRVWTEITFVTLFSLVCFGVHFVRVPVVVHFAATATLERFVQRSVQLLHVDPQVRLATACRGAELTLEHWLITNLMDHFMRL